MRVFRLPSHGVGESSVSPALTTIRQARHTRVNRASIFKAGGWNYRQSNDRD
nr:MAG TPA: hypothetical protein [Caudoviricetes sp.]